MLDNGITSLQTFDSYESIRRKKLRDFERRQEQVARSFVLNHHTDEERSLNVYLRQKEEAQRRKDIANKCSSDQAKADFLSGLQA